MVPTPPLPLLLLYSIEAMRQLFSAAIAQSFFSTFDCIIQSDRAESIIWPKMTKAHNS